MSHLRDCLYTYVSPILSPLSCAMDIGAAGKLIGDLPWVCGEFKADRARFILRRQIGKCMAGFLTAVSFLGWSLPLVGQDYLEILSSWYCSFGKCCETGDCRIANNITGLELDLSRRLHGQHLAKDVILKAVQGFLETPQSEKALALSFHGWSGTGKNFVARMIADHLYRDGLKSECVKVFISLFHFPHPKYVDLYKVQLKKQISETVQLCKQSLFIFDEAEKLHSGLLDAIKPYVDHYDSIDGVDYRRSIFLFLSNTGGNIINQVTLDFWRAGRVREEITMEYLEQHLRLELLESTGVVARPGQSFSATAESPEEVLTGRAVAPLGKSLAFGLSLVRAGPSSSLLGSRSVDLPILSSG
uniref:Torsin-3A n=1 Tax=Gopherus agassizii TaxID=38772 RepID=A0A452HRG4_9SAUR